MRGFYYGDVYKRSTVAKSYTVTKNIDLAAPDLINV